MRHLGTPAHLILVGAIALLAVLCAGDPGELALPNLGRDGVAPRAGEGWPAAGRARLATLTITLRPRVRPTPGIAVIYELSGAAAGHVRSLGMAPSTATTRGPEAVQYLLVRDAKGVIDTAPDRDKGRFLLQRRPQGRRLRVSYLASGAAQPSRLDLSVQDTELSGVGYGFLALPELDARLAVRLSWQLDAIEASQAATSFGVGNDVVTIAKPLELAHSFYVAGPLTVIEGEGAERLISLGEPAFDLEQARAFCSAALHGARQLFEPADGKPFTFVFVPRPGLGSHYDGAALHRSFAIWFDAERELDTRLRLLVAHELVHRWIGGMLRFETKDVADAKWFSEGFTVHYARKLLLREGLIEPKDYLDDVERDLRAQRLVFATQSRRRDADESPIPLHHASPAYYRGALYAARLDTQLRQAGHGGLEQLIASLIERARSEGPALPMTVWRQSLVEALGPTGDLDFDRLVQLAVDPVELPAGALGRCFKRVPVRVAAYELGFSAFSLTDDPAVVKQLVSGSAAERAGLREGDRLLSGAERIREGDPRQLIKLVVAGADGRRIVRYRPRRWDESGQWQLSNDSSCRRATRGD